MSSRIGVVGLAICMALLGALLWQTFRIDAQMSEIRSRNLVSLEELRMQTLTTTWSSGAIEHAVVTPRESGETTEHWVNRHREAVEASQAIWPPN